MFDLSKSFFLSPTFSLPLRLFRGSSSRLCLVLSDIDHSNSLRSTLYRTTSSVSRYPFTFFFLSIYSPILVRLQVIYSIFTVVLFSPSLSLAINVGPSDTQPRNVDSRFAIHPTNPSPNSTLPLPQRQTLSCGLGWICPSLVVKTRAQMCRGDMEEVCIVKRCSLDLVVPL